jgi:hypothetical protein
MFRTELEKESSPAAGPARGRKPPVMTLGETLLRLREGSR